MLSQIEEACGFRIGRDVASNASLPCLGNGRVGELAQNPTRAQVRDISCRKMMSGFHLKLNAGSSSRVRHSELYLLNKAKFASGARALGFRRVPQSEEAKARRPRSILQLERGYS